MPEPEGPEDERFVCVVTAAGVEALSRSAAEFDSERKATTGGPRRLDVAPASAQD
jgi:hypothetical protein